MEGTMSKAQLTISSKTYSAWSLRGWLMCKLAGLDVEEKPVPNDATNRAELLLLSPSVLVPRLDHEGASVWDTLAIAEYLNEIYPDAGMWPKSPIVRAHCRSVAHEIHSGFSNLRSALPMNLKSSHAQFPVFSGAKPDIERIEAIWKECLESYGGPYLFGKSPTIADAMFAPEALRLSGYGVDLDRACADYCDTVTKWKPVREWVTAAQDEPEQIEELEVEF